MKKEIRSRIEWACNFVGKVPKIKERKFENCGTKERKMNFVIKCKNCGKVIKFNEEREKKNKITCSCGKILGYEEEQVIDNLAERLSKLNYFELISATKEKNQEILDEELSELYSLYCEEPDEDSRKMFFAIINRLYLICNRKIRKISKSCTML